MLREKYDGKISAWYPRYGQKEGRLKALGADSGTARQGGARNHIMMPTSAAIAAARTAMPRNLFAAGIPRHATRPG